MNTPTTPELNTKDIRTIAYILLVGMLSIILCLFWAARTINAQNKPPNPTPMERVPMKHEGEYKLTEVQLLKLQVVQKDAFLLKAQIQDLQRQFGDKIADLQRTAEKIKLENGWPPETSFDMDTLKFSTTPVKEEKKQ